MSQSIVSYPSIHPVLVGLVPHCPPAARNDVATVKQPGTLLGEEKGEGEEDSLEI